MEQLFEVGDEYVNYEDGMRYRITAVFGDFYQIEQTCPHMSGCMPVPVTKFVSQEFLVDCMDVMLGIKTL